MKRNLFGIVAIVIAIAVSSFTVKKTVTVYFDYTTSNAHNVRTSYTETQTAQTDVTGTTQLDWFSIIDNNGTITNDEFDDAFDALDRVGTGNSLDDDTEGLVNSVYYLAKKP